MNELEMAEAAYSEACSKSLDADYVLEKIKKQFLTVFCV
jgi:hypothetical protein